jgi:hypothetical protein
MIADDAQHRIAVRFEAREWAELLRHFGGRPVRGAGHQRRDCGAPPKAFLRIVGQAQPHQQRAEICVPEAECPVAMILFSDPSRRHLPHRDGDLERRRPDSSRLGKALRIEITVVVEEFDEVQTCEVAVVRDHALGDYRVRDRFGHVIDGRHAIGNDR